jgi:uncharacterized protein (UPF0212 family)
MSSKHKHERLQIIKVDMGRQFRECPACGYTDGFHNMFEKADKPGLLKWYFICPQCSSIFDIGLTIAKGVKASVK